MNKHDTLIKFKKLIIEAFDSIPQDYYKLRTTYNTNGIVRERVFCYELYHKIRCLQEIKQITDFSIHGEIDKRGHDLFERDDQSNPDFVFHKPGTMKGNLIVVEVKGNLENNGIIKDWNTLLNFCNTYQYSKGLWLVYNYSYNDILGKMRDIERNFEENNAAKIELICKKSADSSLEIIPLSKLLSEMGDYNGYFNQR